MLSHVAEFFWMWAATRRTISVPGRAALHLASADPVLRAERAKHPRPGRGLAPTGWARGWLPGMMGQLLRHQASHVFTRARAGPNRVVTRRAFAPRRPARARDGTLRRPWGTCRASD